MAAAMSSLRGVVVDAIEAWRDGETCDAVHPLVGEPQVQARSIAWLYDPDVVKDLARVIAKHLEAAADPPE